MNEKAISIFNEIEKLCLRIDSVPAVGSITNSLAVLRDERLECGFQHAKDRLLGKLFVLTDLDIIDFDLFVGFQEVVLELEFSDVQASGGD